MKASLADARAMGDSAHHQLITSRSGNQYRVRYAWHRGIRFNSPLECACYQRLEEFQAAGLIRYFLYQLPLRLPGGTKHIVNFEIVMTGREPVWADAKESNQSQGQRARESVRKTYGIDIQVWREPPVGIGL